jgi:hypothetical protein
MRAEFLDGREATAARRCEQARLAGALREAPCNLPAPGELETELSSEDSMAKQLKTGDRVAWQSSGGGSVGRVGRKLTSPGKIKGHEVAASEDNPEFLSVRRSPARSRLTNLPH